MGDEWRARWGRVPVLMGAQEEVKTGHEAREGGRSTEREVVGSPEAIGCQTQRSCQQALEVAGLLVFKEVLWEDFPGGPVVKTSPSNAGGAGLIPGRGAKIPRALWPKKPK